MDTILIINSGSSTIKFSLFSLRSESKELVREYSGMVDKILTAPQLTIKSATDNSKITEKIPTSGDKEENYGRGIEKILEWVAANNFTLVAAGHRVVHGGPEFSAPVILNSEIVEKLLALTPIMPLHQPYNIKGIKVLQQKMPDLLQVACFDTAFHATCNPISQQYAIPKYITDTGVRRYGFHGLSYEYIASQLPNLMSESEAQGKFVVMHLGNGATMCAIENQKSVATSIGFTGLGGLPMGTRCDSVDPGAILYLMETYNLDPASMREFLYKKCGLLGVSELSSDMRDLLASDSAAAKLAVDIFVHRAAIITGQLAAELQGLEGVIFTAGIGEHAAPIREKICQLLRWMDVELDQNENENCSGSCTKISTPNSKIPVWVIPTNEELMIAKHTLSFITD